MVVGDRLKLSVDSLQVMGQLGEHLPPAGVYDARNALPAQFSGRRRLVPRVTLVER